MMKWYQTFFIGCIQKNYLQDLSFGHKVAKYFNGMHATLEAVKLTTDLAKVIKDYTSEWQNQEADDEDADIHWHQDNVLENADYDNGNNESNASPFRCTRQFCAVLGLTRQS